MNEVKKQLLRNPEIPPSSEVLSAALGNAYSIYTEFLGELEKNNILHEWRYYTDGKAWLCKGLYRRTGVRGGKKETTVFWLSVWECFFRASIYFPEHLREDIFKLPLDNEVKNILNSKQMGKLKTFPVVFDFCSEKYFESFFTLANYKKSLK